MNFIPFKIGADPSNNILFLAYNNDQGLKFATEFKEFILNRNAWPDIEIVIIEEDL